jgi:tetratricopeptide (TPR) repeat protein
MITPELFKKIAKFYQDLEPYLVQVKGNVCRECSCSECCTFAARGGNHAVAEMEFDYIEKYYQKKGYPQGDVEQFKDYLSRRRNEKKELIYSICPFFDEKQYGCSIYEARPLSCRLYGSFFVEEFPIPNRCYFKTIGKKIRKNNSLEEIPLAFQFSELKSEHLGSKIVTKIRSTVTPDLSYLENLDFFDMYRQCGRLLSQEKISEAIECYDEICKKYSTWSFITFCAAADFIRAGHYKEAVPYAYRAVELAPDNAFYRFVLAAACQFSGEFEKAVQAYLETVRLNPQNAVAYEALGNLYQHLGNLEKALDHYDKALKISPDQHETLFYSGAVLMQLNRIEEAMERYQKAEALEPNYAPYHYALGVIYERLEKIQEALKEHETAVKLDPTNAPAYLSLGTLYLREGQDEKSLECCRKAVELKPDNALHHFYYGISLLKLNQLEKTEAEMKKSLEINPSLSLAAVILEKIQPR